MLTHDDAAELAADLWKRHAAELPRLDRIYDYARGRRGVPEVPEGANEELSELAQLAVKNVLSVVEDTFAQNLSVVGFRPASAKDNDASWALWQAQRMDARQAEIHRPTIRYGVAYGAVLPARVNGELGPVGFRPRTPRQLFAVYQDPQVDAWPVYALETWVDTSEAKPRRLGMLLDDELAYPLDFGPLSRSEISRRSGEVTESEWRRRAAKVEILEGDEPWAHGGTYFGQPVCPVVRYVNARDAEDVIVGEIEPLITPQRAINAVNFDRLVVSRFGAFPQRYVIGWSADRETILKASMSRVWTFEDGTDEGVSAGAFPAASVEPYNAILSEMLEHVAMAAQISPARTAGKLINLSADALAQANHQEQRKTQEKRESLGESHEQLLGLGGEMSGQGEPDESAEVIWRDTEARSFGTVVDGIQKLAAAGVPLDLLLSQVPGWTQQQVDAASDRLAGSGEIVAALERLANGQPDQGV